MASSRLRVRPVVLAVGMIGCAMPTSGCATYYEDLMSARELISASCADLATEEKKVESNIRASEEGEGINVFAAATMAFVEGSSASGGAYDPNSSVSARMVDGASSSSQLADDFTEKKRLISQLRMKRGCT